MEKLKKEIGERERRWEEERRGMKKRIDDLEKMIGEIVTGKRGEKGEGDREERIGGQDRVEQRLKNVERKMEGKEREERKKNIVIKKIKIDNEDLKGEIGRIMKEIGAEVEIKDIRKVGAVQEGRGIVIITLGNVEQKRQVMEKKRKMRGREEWIDEDLTWTERRSRWKLREIARKEEREGRKVWLGRKGIEIDGEWWKWDEEEEKLKNEKGETRKEKISEIGVELEKGE